MMTDQWNEEDVRELRKVFFAQCREILDDLQDLALRLEAEPGDQEALRTVKRHVHTLKGDSNAMGLAAVGTLCHRLEDVLAPVLEGRGSLDHEAVDLLLSGLEAIERMIAADEAGTGGAGAEDIIAQIDRFLCGPDCTEQAPPQTPADQGLTEYQALEVRHAREKNRSVVTAVITFHPLCVERGVAVRMLQQRLAGTADVIRTDPDPDSRAADKAPSVRMLLSTECDAAEIEKLLRIAGISIAIAVADFREEEYRAALPEHPGSGGLQPSLHTDMVRIDASKVDRIMDLVGELIIGRSMMEQAARELERGLPASDAAERLFAVNAYFDRTVSDLKKAVMKVRMVPINQVFRKFPRMVRDLSTAKGKPIRLEIDGREAELDKGIVDALSEPLAHIVRNLVDHGIETPGERLAAGKPAEGVIVLRAYQEGAHFVVEASDDGRGIDPAVLKRKAVEKGFVGSAEAESLTSREAINLIFRPGFSTAETVSDTSGRGVGMDAVRAAVDALRGEIEVETAIGKGTRFRLRLPLTLAVIKALLFGAGDRQYALPVSAIAEVARVGAGDLTSVGGRTTLLLRDQVISVVDLNDLFHTTAAGPRRYVLIVAFGSRKVGLLIDQLLWQQELVIKAVDEELVPAACVAGASILGDGKVVLILDEQALVRKAIAGEQERMTPA